MSNQFDDLAAKILIKDIAAILSDLPNPKIAEYSIARHEPLSFVCRRVEVILNNGGRVTLSLNETFARERVETSADDDKTNPAPGQSEARS